MLEGNNRSLNRRELLMMAGAVAAGFWRLSDAGAQENRSTSIIEFEETLARMRREHFGNRQVDIINTGFRPVGGKVADFAVIEHRGRCHFYYIERRLQEGTPFYPGHEIYFGHASTADFENWQVHEPVMLVRPGTWEGGHVWAPYVFRHEGEYVMAYTGVTSRMSQDIGLASSTDMFNWRRWDSNPISPARNRPWSFWREDDIASCRDPHVVKHDGRYWMIYTANTREGATCIAMTSSADLRTWEDHGPILVGPADGYEARLGGGHPQGSLESAYLLQKGGTWYLIAKLTLRGTHVINWVFESERMDRFELEHRREFWPGAVGIEKVRDRGDRSLVATFHNGHIRLGVADWSSALPTARFLQSIDELKEWLVP
jgi:hypothetical protein